ELAREPERRRRQLLGELDAGLDGGAQLGAGLLEDGDRGALAAVRDVEREMDDAGDEAPLVARIDRLGHGLGLLDGLHGGNLRRTALRDSIGPVTSSNAMRRRRLTSVILLR